MAMRFLGDSVYCEECDRPFLFLPDKDHYFYHPLKVDVYLYPNPRIDALQAKCDVCPNRGKRFKCPAMEEV